jgi:ribonuclease HII
MLKPFLNKGILEVGCDEAGRGCLAGPVFAAAVALPADFHHPLLNDSKKIAEKVRYELRTCIEQEAMAWAVAKVDPEEIDSINILNASIQAMHLAIAALKKTPQHLLIDGNRFKAYKKIPHTTVIKGDAKFASIAAASILAKTYRDDYLLKLDQEFPMYNWKKNKGYATRDHVDAIAQYGRCIHHRRTFIVRSIDIPTLF